jgi:YVTN family beta-propeller protein
MIIYGSKMYVVMNGSGNVTVLNAANASFISQISFGGTSTNRNPRYAVAARGKVYVTAWDNKVSIIDTTTLAITGNITVGANPEGLAINGDYLYTANSGALNYPDYDSTVSVVDLNSLTELRKIKVGLNPQKIEVNSNGNVYVSAYGDAFATVPVPASISVFSGGSSTTSTILGTGYEFDHVRIFNDIAYFYNNYGGGGIKMYNTISNSLVRNNFITDGTTITTSYGFDIDEQNGDVYICDANDFVSSGSVTCFNANGVKKFSFSVSPGINPNKVLLVR